MMMTADDHYQEYVLKPEEQKRKLMESLKSGEEREFLKNEIFETMTQTGGSPSRLISCSLPSQSGKGIEAGGKSMS